MNQNDSNFPPSILWTLLGGATLGGFVVAFATSHTGQAFRNRIKALANKFNPKAVQSERTDDGIVQAAFI